MTTPSHLPDMIRTRYDEDSEKGQLTMVSEQMLGTDAGKRIIDAGLLINTSAAVVTVILYVVDSLSSESPDPTTKHLCVVLEPMETLMLPKIILQPHWELYGDASTNMSVNFLLGFMKGV